MKKTNLKEDIEKKVAASIKADKRKKFLLVRKLAVSLADRCDFASLQNIKDSRACYSHNEIIICARFKDVLERCQIITAFTYGALLNHLSGHYTSTDDWTVDGHRSGILTMTLSEAQFCPLCNK